MTWSYEPSRTLLGRLQRGLGHGAHQAVREPGAIAREAVLAAIAHDHRWDSVDERAVYLARLVRELRIPAATLIELVPAHEFAPQVLVELGRAGDDEATEGVRGWLGAAEEWADVLDLAVRRWPRERWEGLLPVVRTRMDGTEVWAGSPWREWALADQGIAARIAALPTSRRPSRPFQERPADELLSGLGGPDRRAILHELNRRGPRPELLPLADRLAADDDLRSGLGVALDKLGTAALPLGRGWAATPEHPMRWRSWCLLADHGDESDLPALFAAWDWLDSREDDRCGYDALATGVARIGGPAAQAAVPRLRKLWSTPHSYERAAYLRALTTLDPAVAQRFLGFGLWDCESDVRTYAVEKFPHDDVSREQLRFLRDDPLEDPVTARAAGDALDGR